MSSFLACDWCHQPIDETEPRACLHGMTLGSVTRASFGFKPLDFHASPDRDCFVAVRAAIEMALDCAQVAENR